MGWRAKLKKKTIGGEIALLFGVSETIYNVITEYKYFYP